MGVYGIALAGWSSNNKYALLGGLRSSAQMISYELPMSLAIASPLLIAGTLSLREIVDSQAGYNFGILPKWPIFAGPSQIFSFIIFMIAAFAETNRIPFDLPEAENELVAGFHVEYSSMASPRSLWPSTRTWSPSARRDAAFPGRLASVVARGLRLESCCAADSRYCPAACASITA